MSNFIEDCLSGNTILQEIDNYIDQWHDSQSDQTIYEYLGMTKEEYALFVKDENSLKSIIMAHKQGKNKELFFRDKSAGYSRTKKK